MAKYNKRIFLITLLILMASLLGISKKAYAQGAEFTVSPVFDTNQTNKDLGYFSLNVDKNSYYPITVNVQNTNAKRKNKFEVRLVVASTSNSGKIDYTVGKKNLVKTKDPILTDLVTKETLKKEIELEPNASKNVTFNLKIPKDGIKGTVLGSIYTKRTSNHDENKQNFGIKNSFAMTVPIVLNQNPNKKMVPKLLLEKVKLETNSDKNKVLGTVSNNDPVMFGEIKISAWITSKGRTKKLYTNQSKGYEMAPLSKLEYPIIIKNSLSKGDYTYHLNLSSGKKNFSFKKDFTINKNVNSKQNQIKSKDTSRLILITIGIVILIIVAYLIGRLGKFKNNKY